MIRILSLFFIVFASISLFAQGSFSPAAGEPGSDAIAKDDPGIVAWANKVELNLGAQNILNSNSPLVSVGAENSATGKALENGFVSLGDGGTATLFFDGLLQNGPGTDFAIFENSFQIGNSQLYFIELAFVEVSSDGLNFFRFPSTSLTSDSVQIGAFDGIDPRNIHNLAGKYVAGFGVPFDLDDLPDNPNLDKMNISHIRVIDVVGSVDAAVGSFDSQGNIINDPFPTPFPSGGFDLDAVGLLYYKAFPVSREFVQKIDLKIFPNPASEILQIELMQNTSFQYEVYDVLGNKVREGSSESNFTHIDISSLPKAYYYLKIKEQPETWPFVKY